MKCPNIHNVVVVNWARCRWRIFSVISVHKGTSLSVIAFKHINLQWRWLRLYPDVQYVMYILKCPCKHMCTCIYSKKKMLWLFQVKKDKTMVGRMGLFLSQVPLRCQCIRYESVQSECETDLHPMYRFLRKWSWDPAPQSWIPQLDQSCKKKWV